MAEKVTVIISPVVAAYVRPGTTAEQKRAACTGTVSLSAADRLILLLCLVKDSEPAIREIALSSLKEIPKDIITEYLARDDSNPLVIKALSHFCSNFPLPPPPQDTVESVIETDLIDDPDELDSQQEEDDGAVDEEGEAFKSKYKMVQTMGIAEKIKMALSGDKEWRSILIKDANKLISGSVIKNPRITEAEVITIAKGGIQNDEIMRLICANKEWVKIYKIRKALIENSRTPVQNALKYLATMGDKDLASYAKSKNIPTVIATMAKRLLLNKKR